MRCWSHRPLLPSICGSPQIISARFSFLRPKGSNWADLQTLIFGGRKEKVRVCSRSGSVSLCSIRAAVFCCGDAWTWSHGHMVTWSQPPAGPHFLSSFASRMASSRFDFCRGSQMWSESAVRGVESVWMLLMLMMLMML